ncbi:MAG TPA: hypothetical protein VJT74_10855 [Pyrinomonadaceae bacterium]|nr:hypothetical protein [Pyrinomonadaceae bacterium]
MSEDSQQQKPCEDEMSEAEIDKVLKDSFPASDPPSWTLGTDHCIETTDPPAEEPEQQK